MDNLSSNPSIFIPLTSLNSQDTNAEFQRLVPRESQHEDAPNDQNQQAISISRGNTQRSENSIVLPPEIEILINENPEDCLNKQLQTILERQAKCRIRKGFMFCLMLSLGSWTLKLEWNRSMEGEYSIRIIFMFCYAFLSYLLIEFIIQFKNEEILRWKKIENLCMANDIVVVLLILLAGDFKYHEYEFPVKLLLAPLIANFVFYRYKSQASNCNIILRLYYVIMLSLIIINLNNDLHSMWMMVGFLSRSFSLLAVLYCFIMGVVFIHLVLSSSCLYIYQDRTLASESLTIGLRYLWLCLLCSNGFYLLGVYYIVVLGTINFIFCLFTLLAYNRLKKSFVTGSPDAAIYRKELEKIFLPRMFLIRKKRINLELFQVSSTYFTSSKNNEDNNTTQDTSIYIDNDTNNENLCYICYNKAPDAVMAGCGHGGICEDCAIANIKDQGKCMQCRQKAQAILKLDVNSVRKNSIKAVEAIVIKGKPERTGT